MVPILPSTLAPEKEQMFMLLQLKAVLLNEQQKAKSLYYNP